MPEEKFDLTMDNWSFFVIRNISLYQIYIYHFKPKSFCTFLEVHSTREILSFEILLISKNFTSQIN